MKKVHFIAIGGSAMHNLALAMQAKGYVVTGSDDEIFEPARGNLLRAGILPERDGWFPEKLNSGIGEVILGMHAKKDNPELLRAQELGLKIYSYPEYLYLQSRDKTRIVVGGSHGKTTITGMVLHVMRVCGLKTDFMIGAKIDGIDLTVSLTDSAPTMVFEGDEYLTSPIDPRPKFHLYRPHIALISGIAWDHINVFPDYETYIDQFRQFIGLVEEGGCLIYCGEDKELLSLAGEFGGKLEMLEYKRADAVVEQGKTFLIFNGMKYPLNVFGNHNLLNISGAMEICRRLQISGQDFCEAITTFRGAANRLESIGNKENTSIFKDFAHAPSKVKASLEAVRQLHPGRRIVAVLELHTYSSLNKQFLPQYKGSLDPADCAMVYFNPHAIGLKRLPMISEEDIMRSFAKEGLQVFSESGPLFERLARFPSSNTDFLLMSSGNFDGMNIVELADILLKSE